MVPPQIKQSLLVHRQIGRTSQPLISHHRNPLAAFATSSSVQGMAAMYQKDRSENSDGRPNCPCLAAWLGHRATVVPVFVKSRGPRSFDMT